MPFTQRWIQKRPSSLLRKNCNRKECSPCNSMQLKCQFKFRVVTWWSVIRQMRTGYEDFVAWFADTQVLKHFLCFRQIHGRTVTLLFRTAGPGRTDAVYSVVAVAPSAIRCGINWNYCLLDRQIKNKMLRITSLWSDGKEMRLYVFQLKAEVVCSQIFFQTGSDVFALVSSARSSRSDVVNLRMVHVHVRESTSWNIFSFCFVSVLLPVWMAQDKLCTYAHSTQLLHVVTSLSDPLDTPHLFTRRIGKSDYSLRILVRRFYLHPGSLAVLAGSEEFRRSDASVVTLVCSEPIFSQQRKRWLEFKSPDLQLLLSYCFPPNSLIWL